MDAFFSKLAVPRIDSLPVFSDIAGFDVAIDVKRDDLIDTVVSGNKLFKLHCYLQQWFEHNQYETLVTFGGAYSNHLHACAYVGRVLGIKTVGFVRAEAHELKNLTPTLQDCQQWGMQLKALPRSEYKLKQASPLVQRNINSLSSPYWIAEGGAGELGVKGAELILKNVDQSQYDVIVLACGTGTTLAGVIRASEPHIEVIGIPVLKGAGWMQAEVEQYLKPHRVNWRLELGFHFSGYAKRNQALLDFIEVIKGEVGLPLDPVYTAKAFYGLVDLIKHNKIKKGARVLFIHTGGLQGERTN